MGSPVGGPGAKGDSLADAARVLRISRQRATALAKRHGIEFQRLQATGKWTKQLRAMAAAKVALSDAARELGISRQRASAIAKRAGILFLRRPAAKRDRARKRLPGSCSECGGAMGEGRWVRCEKCRSAAAERERAKVAERRRAELCPRCGREPEEGKVRARNATWADEGERSGGARPVCRTYENRLLGPRIRLCYKTGRAGQMVPGRPSAWAPLRGEQGRGSRQDGTAAAVRPKCLQCGAPAISARRQAAGETVCQACVAEVSAGLCAGCARPHEGVAESRLCRDCADTAGHAGARASPWFPGLEPRAGRSAPNGEGE